MKPLFKFGPKKTEETQSTSDVEAVAAAARACLGTEQFHKYAEKYQSLERSIIEELIKDARLFSMDNSTLEKFGGKCLVRLTRLYDLRTLLTSVTTDANKKGASDGKDGKEEPEKE